VYQTLIVIVVVCVYQVQCNIEDLFIVEKYIRNNPIKIVAEFEIGFPVFQFRSE
jgi:hypothetical protein